MAETYRFYVRPEQVKDNLAVLDQEETRHALTVKRMNRGAAIILFDGQGREHSGIVRDIIPASKSGKSGKNVLVEISRTEIVKEDVLTKIVLACVLPKKNLIDLVIQKATELGVNKVIPALSLRSTARPLEAQSQEHHRQRWQRISIEAAKQCGRSFLPQITDITDITEVLSSVREYDLFLFAALTPAATGLKEILSTAKRRGGKISNIICFVGPEGDFSPEEVEMAQRCGCKIASLGNLTLRVETAALYFMSILRYEFS